MSPEKSKQKNIETDLEKKTQLKITQMTDDINTMDFVLKNIKLIKRIKRCRVRLAKVASGKFLSKKNANIGKIKSKKRDTSNKSSKSISNKIFLEKKKKNRDPKVFDIPTIAKANESSPKKAALTNENDSAKSQSSQKQDIKTSRKSENTENEKIITPSPPKEDNPTSSPKSENTENEKVLKGPSAQKPAKKISPKSEDSTDKKTSTKSKKTDQLPKNKRKEDKKKRQIFIQLPFLERAKMRCLGKTLSVSEIMKKQKKKQPQIKLLGRTYLTQKFGGKFFRCHVKVARYRDPKNPAFRKKDKTNRKSVSFVETVEVFGESDDEISVPCSSTPDKDKDNNSILCVESDSETSVSASPKKRKISSLKNNGTSRSERMRKSDEKIPRLQENEESDNSGQLSGNLCMVTIPEVNNLPTGEDSPDALSNEVDKNKESSEDKETRAEKEKKDIEKERQSLKKRRMTVDTAAEVTVDLVKEEPDKYINEKESKTDKENESISDKENEEDEQSNINEVAVDQSSSSICTKLNSTYEKSENSEMKISQKNESNNSESEDEDIFVDADDKGHNSEYVLQLSANSEKSIQSENKEESSVPNSETNNINSNVETSQPLQKKFSLNTFFKFPESNETSPGKNRKQQQRDEDEPIRDELTIK